MKAGEQAEANEDIRCERCGTRTRVRAGARIPECGCGNKTFRSVDVDEEGEEDDEL
jgi:ribosomal protein L37E